MYGFQQVYYTVFKISYSIIQMTQLILEYLFCNPAAISCHMRVSKLSTKMVSKYTCFSSSRKRIAITYLPWYFSMEMLEIWVKGECRIKCILYRFLMDDCKKRTFVINFILNDQFIYSDYPTCRDSTTNWISTFWWWSTVVMDCLRALRLSTASTWMHRRRWITSCSAGTSTPTSWSCLADLWVSISCRSPPHPSALSMWTRGRLFYIMQCRDSASYLLLDIIYKKTVWHIFFFMHNTIKNFLEPAASNDCNNVIGPFSAEPAPSGSSLHHASPSHADNHARKALKLYCYRITLNYIDLLFQLGNVWNFLSNMNICSILIVHWKK